MTTIAGAGGDKRHPLKDRGADLYETPPEATAALLGAENLPEVIWEPACGRGAIVRPLRATGRTVYATDLVDYDCRDQDEARWDFLMETQLPIGVQAIVTNPPFANASKFVRHALELCPRVYMLLRLAFLEGTTRSDILDGGRLRRVHVFKNRLPMMNRDGWTGPQSTSTMAFAWFVFDADQGPTELRRISWVPVSGTEHRA